MTPDRRDFFLWSIPETEAVQHLEQDAQVYQHRREQRRATAATVDWEVDSQTRMLRLTLKKGLPYKTVQIE